MRRFGAEMRAAGACVSLDTTARSGSYPGVPGANADVPIERTRASHASERARGLGCAALLFVLVSRPALADEPGLTIETGSPDALCPDLATTRAAVQRRLGQLVMPDGSAFTARYTIGHAPAGSPRDFVRLELFGPDQSVQLSRDLPLDGESCSTMADVIALVLDRHFRALLGREPSADEVEPSASPATAAGADPAPAGAPPAPASGGTPLDAGTAPIDGAPLLRAPPETELRATSSARESASGLTAFSLELAFREPARPALGGRAVVNLWPHGVAGAALHVGLVPDREKLPAGGEVTSNELVTRAFVAWASRLGAFDAYAGPGLRLSVARGAGRGLGQDAAGIRLLPCFGADAGLVWRSDEHWALSASAALDVMVPRLGGWFAVEDVDVLVPAPVRVWLGVGIGYAP